MGSGGNGGDKGRAGRRLGPLIASAAGAAVVAAAVARRQQRRRRAAIAPKDAVAGPPIDEVEAPTDTPAPARDGEPSTDPGGTPVDTPAPDVQPVADPPRPMAATAPAQAPSAPSPEPGGRRRLRPRLVVGSVVAVALMLGAAALAASAGDERPRADATATVDDVPGTQQTTTTTAPPVTAADAFGRASQRLTEAGSFSYTGTASATDVSHVRPMLWLAVESTIDGQVATSTGRLHEVAVTADGGVAETVTDGPSVWGRRASAVDDLADEPYQAIPGLSGSDETQPALGAALLPAWLTQATDPVESGVDDVGRRTFQATIPADAFGEIERDRRPVDATVVLTLDDAGDPVRIEITSDPEGPALHIVFEITGLGAPVVIELPV